MPYTPPPAPASPGAPVGPAGGEADTADRVAQCVRGGEGREVAGAGDDGERGLRQLGTGGFGHGDGNVGVVVAPYQLDRAGDGGQLLVVRLVDQLHVHAPHDPGGGQVVPRPV